MSHIYICMKGAYVGYYMRKVVHFGGYKVGEMLKQKVQIVNKSGVSQRVHMLMPSSSQFSAKVVKRGIVAPGMSEVVVLSFRAEEWKYYYDSIRIHSDAGNLLVPIHAYPTINEVKFPRIIGKSCWSFVLCFGAFWVNEWDV